MPDAGVKEEIETQKARELREDKEKIVDDLMQVEELLKERDLVGAFKLYGDTTIRKESLVWSSGNEDDEDILKVYERVKNEVDREKVKLENPDRREVTA